LVAEVDRGSHAHGRWDDDHLKRWRTCYHRPWLRATENGDNPAEMSAVP
jgi:hypothetical protein